MQEAVTFTFMESAAAEPFAADAGSLVAIANPLSEKFAVLRPSMWPGLLDALIYNRRRDIADVRLFEAGSVFHATGEQQRVGWVLAGARFSHWSQPPVKSLPVRIGIVPTLPGLGEGRSWGMVEGGRNAT